MCWREIQTSQWNARIYVRRRCCVERLSSWRAKTARVVLSYRCKLGGHKSRGPRWRDRWKIRKRFDEWSTAPDVAALFGIPGTRQPTAERSRRRGPSSGAVGFSRAPRRGSGISPATPDVSGRRCRVFSVHHRVTDAMGGTERKQPVAVYARYRDHGRLFTTD